MKICVYAICKNEKQFVEKWLDNMSEADYICVLDTGSTDGTYSLLKNDPRVTKVVKKEIKPWRFDVARNESMELIPDDADILVCTDFDELFNKGWADPVRAAWEQGQTFGINRLRYRYAWSHDDSGCPTDVFIYDKIHNRDFKWSFPVHEVLTPKDESIEVKAAEIGDQILLEHFRDKSKSRSYYFDLLKLSCEENPDDCHVRMLLAREYLIKGDLDEALKQYEITANMPDIDTPDKESVLLETLGRIASIKIQKGDYIDAIWYCHEFLKTNKTYREPYFLLGEAYNLLEMYDLAKAVTETGLKLGQRKYSWVERGNTWTTWADEILSISEYQLGNYQEAIKHAKIVVQHKPNDIVLLHNYIAFLETYLNNKVDEGFTAM